MRKKLKEIRLQSGLSQEEVADGAGIKRVTYTNIELGNKNPSYMLSVRIKNVLGYQGDDIFFDNEGV